MGRDVIRLRVELSVKVLSVERGVVGFRIRRCVIVLLVCVV